MNQIRTRGLVLLGSCSLALSMVLVNYAFEAVGSVTDIEACGFLAGNLLSQCAICATLAFAITTAACRQLMRLKSTSAHQCANAGSMIGLFGTALYMVTGAVSALCGDYFASISPNLWGIVGLFILVNTTTARIAGQLTAIRFESLRMADA